MSVFAVPRSMAMSPDIQEKVFDSWFKKDMRRLPVHFHSNFGWQI